MSSLSVVIVALALTAGCSGSDAADPLDSVPAVTDTSSGSSVPDFELEVDENVIVATEDGSLPTMTTEPSADGTPDEPPSADVTTTTAAPVAIPEPDEIGRIVSLSPTHTETLYALGLGDFVVAVDRDSDFPEAALEVREESLGPDTSGLDVLLGLDPDIVIIGDDPTDIVGRLNAAGVPSYSGPPADSVEEVFTQIEDIADLVGQPELADELVTDMRDEIESIVSSLPDGATDLTVFHEIDPSLFTTGSDSFLSDVYATVGLTNIAGPGDVDQAGQVTQMTSDEVVAADPDVIVLADVDCCDVTIDRLASRDGWSDISAVEDGAVVPVSDGLAMRWGPRVVDLLSAVAGGVAAAAA